MHLGDDPGPGFTSEEVASGGTAGARIGTDAPTGAAASGELTSAVSAPLKTIEGINYDTSRRVPPDPHGAAGPGHVVSVVNSYVQWHTKDGVRQRSEPLSTFMAPLSPLTRTFDPRVVFDPHANRFVVVSLERTYSPSPSDTSRVLIAVSDDADPNGVWHHQAIDARQTIGGIESWADYPAVAFDAQALYVTSNMYGFTGNPFTGSRLWIVNKGGLYSGGTAAVTLHDPSAAAALGGRASTLQPALVYGTAPAGLGTFLINSGWTSGATDFLSVIRVSNPLTAPAFSNQFISLGDLHTPTNPAAPQPGGAAALDAGTNRMLQAVWRNNSLYGVNTINPSSGPDAGQATAHWYRINTASPSSLFLADHGNIGGEDLAPGTHTFYPAVAVDAGGNVGFGFSASGPGLYASACYTGRLATDPAGTVRAGVRFAEGQDAYTRTDDNSRNRWGDYSGISVDPAAGSTFWAFNEYALPRGSGDWRGDGRWGTRWAAFTVAAAANVVGRYVFYNRSAFDGHDRFASAGDDAAIATDKQALLGGQTGAFANYTSYGRGINGVMIDVARLPQGSAMSAADFELHSGGGAAWSPGPAPEEVALRREVGRDGSDRVTLILPDYAARNTWLRVTVKATASTGLSSPDVFYFGNLVGETGNGVRSAKVDVIDLALVRSNFGSVAARPSIARFDFNRDGRVNAVDLGTTRANHGRSMPLFSASLAVATASARAEGSVWMPPPLRRTYHLPEGVGLGVLS